MSADALFPVVNLPVTVAWILLLLLPRQRWVREVLPIALPAALGVAYVALLAVGLPGTDGGGYGSLAAVRALFADPHALLAGWTHYLAFDLFLGGWQVRDAQRRGVPHLLVAPSLILTFLFGPAGLVLYLVIRRFAPGRPVPVAVE